MTLPLLRKVDAVTFRVPDLDSGIGFYVDRLGHTLDWRNDDLGSAGLALPESDAENVLTTEHAYEPNWLVDSVEDALELLAMTLAHLNDAESSGEVSVRVPLLIAIRDKLAAALREEP